jgi:hypothetical protein
MAEDQDGNIRAAGTDVYIYRLHARDAQYSRIQIHPQG